MARENGPHQIPSDAAPLATIDLLAGWPEIAAYVPSADLHTARRALITRALVVDDEDPFAVLGRRADCALAFLVIDGAVLKVTTLARRRTLELLGPGDFLAPPLSAERQIESPAVSRYVAHGRASIGVLDDRFRQAARRWPGLSDCLHQSLARQSHHTSMHMAMLHLPRVEDRVAALFADLAERFGVMTPDGIVIELALTHEIIGGLVGSRRPTVSLALQALAADGVLSRLDANRWSLASSALAL